MQINIKLEEIDRALRTYSPRVVQQATRRALDTITKRARTTTSTEIRRTYNIKKKNLDAKTMKIIKARMRGLTAELIVSGRPISLAYFNARQTGGKRVVTRTKTYYRKRASKFVGVTVEIKKGKKTQLPGHFLARMRSGHIGVFKQLTAERLPIAEPKMVTIPSLFAGPNVMPAVKRRIETDWPKVFVHELKFFMDKTAR